ncbi:putative regulatory protein [Candidatus Sodalis pierantonius str. SOPE]|uniref:Putative regulatory protein n=1 Tax=Candidatus Sodalis pierantonii str. SOPE TaxID=2342 RepID=W0HPE5_9GAMM|nr:hypothetical protein [Candidatus Sodalis pierantonius]AHF74372.1 putative regulatory protein [Candidatus Sodalis pierantonius str. SOPE]
MYFYGKEPRMRKERLGIFQTHDKEPVIDRIAQLARIYPSRSVAARAWGININTLNSYYKREANPPMPRENLLSRIAKCEGVTLEWLQFGDGKTPKTPNKTEDRDGLVDMLSFLTKEEREQLTTMLARKGVETVLYLLDENNIELLRLDHVVKEKILGKQPQTQEEAVLNARKARECGLDGNNEAGEEILTSYSKRAV